MKEVAQEVLKIFSSFGYKAYIVGGFPRNQYLNINSNDIDICTNATPNEIETKMSKVFNIKNKNGINYGSITIIYKNYNFEITTFRKEKKYINNSLCYINAYLNIYFSYKRDFIETRKRKSRKRY